MRFAIVLPLSAHSDALREVAQLLEAGLRELGHEVRQQKQPSQDEWRDLFVGSHLAQMYFPDQLRAGSILYNFEPSGSPIFKIGLPASLRADLVTWDYSRQGVETFRSLGIHALHVPLGYSPAMRTLTLSSVPEYDVLFYGSYEPRRTAVLDECAKRGLRVKHLFRVFGQERDRYIEQSKVVLNLHSYPDSPTEDVRLTHLVANGVCVVSEGRRPDEPRKTNWAIWTDYEYIVDQCVNTVNVYPSMRREVGRIAFESFSGGLQEKDILRDALGTQ